MRREFGPHPAADLLEPLPRWWTGEPNEFGEPEQAAVFGRRIDAEATFRTVHGQIDPQTRAQRLSDALLEVGYELPFVPSGAGTPDRRRAFDHYVALAAEAVAAGGPPT